LFFWRGASVHNAQIGRAGDGQQSIRAGTASRVGLVQARDDMGSIETTVKALELELLQPATRASTQRLDALLANDFLEVGASGQSFGKSQVLVRLPEESDVGFAVTDMHAHVLAPTVVLVTYLAERTHEGRTTRSRRSSLWVNDTGSWRMRYHQGTHAEALPPP
jgi:hypothetical protein